MAYHYSYLWMGGKAMHFITQALDKENTPSLFGINLLKDTAFKPWEEAGEREILSWEVYH